MAFTTNDNKMMHAVLKDERLIKIGEYSNADIPENIYTAMGSDNYVINVVATIIRRFAEGDTSKEIYNKINNYLQKKL